MHAGAGVLLVIMTNFASHKANNKEQNDTKNKRLLPHISTSENEQHKVRGMELLWRRRR
jgi:hypothetical protein